MKSFKVAWLLVLSILTWCLLIGGCNGTDGTLYSDKNFEVTKLSDKGILTMSPSGSHPITQYKGCFNRTYFGYYSSSHEIVIRWFDNDNLILSEPKVLWKDWGYNSAGNKLGDDHANPAIIVLRNQRGKHSVHNGKLLVAAAEHGSGIRNTGRLEVKRGLSPETIDRWQQSVSLRDNHATYARMIEMADGTIFLFCRLSRVAPNSRATFFFWKSDDAGDTWTEGNLLIDAAPGTDDAIYITVDTDEDHRNLHVAANRMDYDNPSKGVWRYRDVYYLQYHSNTKTWHRANGTSLGDPPFYLDELEKVYESESKKGSEDWTYICDIKVSSLQPHLVSITDHGRGSADALSEPRAINVYYHTFRDESWQTEKVGDSSRGKSVGFHYPTMATITSLRPIKILGFIQSEEDVIPACYIRKIEGWNLDDKFLRLTNPNGVHARPFTVGFENTGLVAIWSRIRGYHGTPYTDWKSDVIGLVKHE